MRFHFSDPIALLYIVQERSIELLILKKAMSDHVTSLQANLSCNRNSYNVRSAAMFTFDEMARHSPWIYRYKVIYVHLISIEVLLLFENYACSAHYSSSWQP